MKAVVVIGEIRGGGLVSVAGDTASEVLELAAKARKSGTLEGKSIVGGVVLSTQSFYPLKSFRCDPVVKSKAK